MTYYSQRKSVKDGVPQTPNNRYGTRAEMERQFHLYCASACISEEFDVDAIEWGTIEGGIIERKKYTKPVTPTPEPEPETPDEDTHVDGE